MIDIICYLPEKRAFVVASFLSVFLPVAAVGVVVTHRAKYIKNSEVLAPPTP